MAAVSMSFSNFQPRLPYVMQQLQLTPEQVKHNQKRALTAMGAWMFKEMRNALEPGGAQGQPGSGESWRPLSAEWIAKKANEGRPTHIGIYEGRMQNSISTDTRMMQLEVETGPTVQYAEYFDSLRPITPAEDYAARRFQTIVVDAMGGGTI